MAVAGPHDAAGAAAQGAGGGDDDHGDHHCGAAALGPKVFAIHTTRGK